MNTGIKARNRILSFALAVCLLLGMVVYLPGPVTVRAAPSGSAGDANDGVDFDGLMFYYGTFTHYNGSGYDSATPILWRVMGEDPDTGYMVALSEYIVDRQAFDSSNQNAYAGSGIQNWLDNTFAGSGNFPGAEEHFAEPTTVYTRLYDVQDGAPLEKTSAWGGDIYDDEGIAQTSVTQQFYLPWGTLGFNPNNGSYDPWSDGRSNKVGWDSGANKYSDNVLGDATAGYKGGSDYLYWLRSPSSVYSDHALPVSTDGSVGGGSVGSVDGRLGVRPAFQLNPSSVIFTSEIKSGTIEDWETEADGTYYAASGGVAKNYKLTIVSPDVSLNSLSVADGRLGSNGTSLTIASGGTLSMTGDFTGAENLVYKIVDRNSNTIVGYGKETGGSLDVSATANVTGSGPLSNSNEYTLYVWAQKDGGIHSHEGSQPVWYKLNVGTANSVATLASVAGESITSNVTTGNMGDPYINSIDLDHSKDKITVGDIVPTDTSATVNLYTDAGFSANEDSDILLTPGTPADLYIKVTAEDGITMRHYKVAATRGAAPLALTDNTLPAGVVGETYTGYYLTADVIGGKQPYTFMLDSGNLPDGLDLNSATGEIYGTPTQAVDNHSFDVKVTDDSSPQQTDTATYTITIQPAGASTPPSVSTNTLAIVKGQTDTFTVSLGTGTDAAASADISSDDTATATVDTASVNTDGTVITVTGEAEGTTDITITWNGGPRDNTTDTVSVTVTDAGGSTPGQPTLPTATPTTLPLHVENNPTGTVTLSLGMSGDGATPLATEATAVSSNEDVATVPYGPHNGDVTITAEGSGTAIITFTFDDPDTTEAKVTVTVSGSEETPGPGDGDGDGGGEAPDPSVPGGGSSGSRSRSSSSGGSNLPTPVKTRLPASAFSWEGRTLTIDHDNITPLGLLSVRWDDETLTRGTDYGVYQGSVIVRFGEGFIATQSPGDHTVRVEFLNHTGETTVTVGETGLTTDEPNDDLFDNDTHNPNTGGYPDGSYPGTDNPNTGDGRGIWFALLLGSIGAAALVKLRPRLEVK